MNRIIIALAIILAYFSCDAQQYGYIEQPICWTIGGVDSSLTRIVYSNVQGGGPISTHVINATGNIVSIIGGTVSMGYCGCCEAGQDSSAVFNIYNHSDTLTGNRLVTSDNNSNAITFESITLSTPANGLMQLDDKTLFGNGKMLSIQRNGTEVGYLSTFVGNTVLLGAANGVNINSGASGTTVNSSGAIGLTSTGSNIILRGVDFISRNAAGTGITRLPNFEPPVYNSFWRHNTDQSGEYVGIDTLPYNFPGDSIVYVAPWGNSATYRKGYREFPLPTLAEGIDSVSAGGTVVVMPGNYQAANLLKDSTWIHFEPGAVISSGSTTLFNSATTTYAKITGHLDIDIGYTGDIFSLTNGVNAEISLNRVYSGSGQGGQVLTIGNVSIDISYLNISGNTANWLDNGVQSGVFNMNVESVFYEATSGSHGFFRNQALNNSGAEINLNFRNFESEHSPIDAGFIIGQTSNGISRDSTTINVRISQGNFKKRYGASDLNGLFGTSGFGDGFVLNFHCDYCELDSTMIFVNTLLRSSNSEINVTGRYRHTGYTTAARVWNAYTPSPAPKLNIDVELVTDTTGFFIQNGGAIETTLSGQYETTADSSSLILAGNTPPAGINLENLHLISPGNVPQIDKTGGNITVDAKNATAENVNFASNIRAQKYDEYGEEARAFAGLTNGSGEITITLNQPMPSGNYHIDISILSGIFPWFSTVVSSTNTSFTIKVWNTTGASVNNTAVAGTYHIEEYR